MFRFDVDWLFMVAAMTGTVFGINALISIVQDVLDVLAGISPDRVDGSRPAGDLAEPEGSGVDPGSAGP